MRAHLGGRPETSGNMKKILDGGWSARPRKCEHFANISAQRHCPMTRDDYFRARGTREIYISNSPSEQRKLIPARLVTRKEEAFAVRDGLTMLR